MNEEKYEKYRNQLLKITDEVRRNNYEITKQMAVLIMGLYEKMGMLTGERIVRHTVLHIQRGRKALCGRHDVAGVQIERQNVYYLAGCENCKAGYMALNKSFVPENQRITNE